MLTSHVLPTQSPNQHLVFNFLSINTLKKRHDFSISFATFLNGFDPFVSLNGPLLFLEIFEFLRRIIIHGLCFFEVLLCLDYLLIKRDRLPRTSSSFSGIAATFICSLSFIELALTLVLDLENMRTMWPRFPARPWPVANFPNLKKCDINLIQIEMKKLKSSRTGFKRFPLNISNNKYASPWSLDEGKGVFYTWPK